ncbi:MAG: phage tail tape measure protein [Oscillospiraceae bacterium]|nr:phage tail tape measure protein [Oscillospiraceae bacterium]
MNDRVAVIEVVTQVTDETASGARSAEANVSKLERSMTKLQKQIAGMKGKSKLEVAATLKDMASKGIQNVAKAGKKIAGKIWTVTLKSKDFASKGIQVVAAAGKKIGGKVWTVTLKAKDLVTAPFKKIWGLLSNPVTQMAAVAGVSLGTADTIGTFKDFEQGMANVKAISGATNAEYDRLYETAKRLGENTMFSAAQSAGAMENLAMAGWKSSNIVSGMPGLLDLAAAGDVDLANAASITSAALAQFNLNASESTRVADVLAKTATSSMTDVGGLGESLKMAGTTAGALGYSIEDTALALGLMGNAAVDASSAGTALRAVLSRMSKQEGMTAEESNAMAAAMKKVGVTMTDETGKSKSLLTVMRDLRAGFKGMSETEKAATAANLAGMNAQAGLLAIVNASDEKFEELAAAIRDAKGAAREMSNVKMDTLQGSLLYLQSAAEGVKISIGEKLQPYIRRLVDWVTAHMPDIQDAVGSAADFILGKIDDISASIKDLTGSTEWQNAETIWDKIEIAWDKLIAEPFDAWWNGKGKSWLAEKAGSIGEGFGTALKIGILTLFGIDTEEAAADGKSIAASFAKGFADGLDFSLIAKKMAEGFSNMLRSAGKFLPGGESPDLASLLSLLAIGRITKPALSLGRGAVSIGQGIFGKNPSTGVSLAGVLLGTAVSGRGLLGRSAGLAINLGAGNLPGAASLSAGALSATGMAAGAGAAAAGTTLISGALDAYKAFKSDIAEEKAAYQKSAGAKMGGVAQGALVGGYIGSAIPVLGPLAGALIGAGVGGIAGWIKGNKIKQEYQKKVEEMQKEAEKAQKVFEATGFSIEAVTFETKALNDAIQDTSVDASQLGAMFHEAVTDKLNRRFGTLKLTMKDIQRIASSMVFDQYAGSITAFSSAVSDAQSALAAFQGETQSLDKLNWKAGLGLTLDENGKEEYITAVDSFAASAKAYVEDKQYEAAAAWKLLSGDGADQPEGLNAVYMGLQAQIDAMSGQLGERLHIALEDGVISLNEQAEIVSLQQQITDITNKLTKAQDEASLASIKIRYGGAQLDAESFALLQGELQANVESMTQSYDNALEVSLTNLELQLSEEEIDQTEYKKQLDDIVSDYNASIDSLHARVESFQLEAIAEAFSKELEGVLPGIEGTTAEKLSAAMSKALRIEPEPANWTAGDVARWFGLEGLSGEAQVAIAQVLQATAKTIPQRAQESVIRELSGRDYDFSTGLERFANSFESELTGQFENLRYLLVGEKVGDGVGSAIQNINMNPIISAIGSLKSGVETSINTAFSAGVNAVIPVNTKFDYKTGGSGNLAQTLFQNAAVTATAHAEGGILTRPHLGLVAEDGAEAIIPLSSSRRDRGIELWEQAGELLGVRPYAEGEIAGNAYPIPSADGNSGGMVVPVTIENVTIEINVDGGAQDPQELAEIIKQYIQGATDEIAYQLAIKLQQAFANMPKEQWG